MNETIITLLNRRSIRKYLAQQISDSDLDIILKTALYAPNGGNHQLVRFIVVQNPQKLEEINNIVKNEFAKMDIIEGNYQNKTIIKAKKDGYNCMFHAPTIIIAIAPRKHCNSMADSALALGNIQLAATSLNLGTCWINQPHWLTNFESMRSYMYKLGMSAEEDIFGSVALGYSALPLHKPSKRKEGRIIKVM